MAYIKTHRDLIVFKNALDAALIASRLTVKFPKNELSLQDQLRRAARAPGAAIAEAWRKRHYRAYWVNKLSDAQSEAAEAQYWVEIGWREGYCSETDFDQLFQRLEVVIAQLGTMITQGAKWNPSPKK